ncbi:alcohol dehydrogenase catalytic domain-containing protein [Novosphingobium sp. JCM 18896]|uniref:alcohol dehydrogenase catalytic domain-containing protein n=1 Tax=Novosphingobium sp. JCM 18896 TaxID=2989731 RepID=UPI00222223DD|nr:alcohol dehydrogenase catalytic domain-containing protein [Novosphingobium sp. JCM 18896]MCW1432044.1 alcohol dehydrogenase catalytic domain-containing protein [Novosphingobium sp. JCM 18896]
MKAVVYNGPKDVSVNTIDDPKIEKQTDVIIRLTTTNICGSDLHMYEGRTSFEKGKVFGHENLGEVIEVGSAVDRIKKGDRVCMQRRLRFLRKLRTRFDGVLPHDQPWNRRRSVWLCRDGAVARWSGRVDARSLCGLQLSEAA